MTDIEASELHVCFPELLPRNLPFRSPPISVIGGSQLIEVLTQILSHPHCTGAGVGQRLQEGDDVVDLGFGQRSPPSAAGPSQRA